MKLSVWVDSLVVQPEDPADEVYLLQAFGQDSVTAELLDGAVTIRYMVTPPDLGSSGGPRLQLVLHKLP